MRWLPLLLVISSVRVGSEQLLQGSLHLSQEEPLNAISGHVAGSRG